MLDYFDMCAEAESAALVTMDAEGQAEGFAIPRLRPDVAEAWKAEGEDAS